MLAKESQKCAMNRILFLYTIYAVFRSTVKWSEKVGQEEFKGRSPKITESPLNRDQVSAKVSMGYSPKEHFADEAVLVDRLLILAFWHLGPHLTSGQREAKTV